MSHTNITNNAKIVGDAINMTEEDTVLVNVPLFHCFGQVMGVLAAVQRGAGVVLPSYTFDAEAALKAVVDYKATAFYGVPTMYIAVLDALRKQPGAVRTGIQQHLRTGIMAGSICPIELLKRVESEFGIREQIVCYGMTETSPVSMYTSPTDSFEMRTETVGRVAPHTEAKIIDPNSGLVVRRHEKGELCVRGYLVMKGYYGDEEKTNESIVNGWMHTGDLATMDDEGYVRIVGRIKDMISRGGEKVFPKEVEMFLYEHPQIRDVAVYGIHDAVFGEDVAATIVLQEGSHSASLTADEVKAYLKKNISYYKVPRHIRFTTQLPLTASGKIQKFILKALHEQELAAADPNYKPPVKQ